MMSAIITVLLGVVSLLILVILCVLYLFNFNPILLHWIFTRLTLLRAGMSIKYLHIGDYRYCYAEKGKGNNRKPTILFLHGFTSSKDMFSIVARALQKDLHIILIDMPGHGLTTQKMKDDHSYAGQARKIHQFVESYGLNKTPFHICGTSMGGAVAGIYAALYPKDVVKVTLICPSGIITPKLSKYAEMAKNNEEDLLRPENADDFRKMLGIVMHKRPYIPDWYLKIAVAVRKPHEEFYANLMTELRCVDSRDALNVKLKDIKANTQVIWGKYDKIIDVSGAEVIKEALGDMCRVDLIDDCGHSIAIERPYKMAKILTQFINS